MRLAIGTANFYSNYGIKKSNLKSKKKIDEILKYLKKYNILTLDTAISYKGNKKLFKNHNLKKFKIVSKIKLENKTNFINYYKNLIEKNLINSNLKSFNTLLVHNVEILKNNAKKTNLFFKLIKREKLTKKIGFSIYDLEDLKLVLNKAKPDVIQIPINVLNPNFSNKGLIKKLRNKKIEIHARSIFLQGLLLRNKLPKRFENYANLHSKWSIFCKNNSIDQINACISFVKQFQVNYIICGLGSIEELYQISKIFKNLKKKINFNKLNINSPKSYYDPRHW